MKNYLLIAVGLIVCLPVHGQERSTIVRDITIWYDAFNKRHPALAQQIMSEDWIDIPAAPGQPPGRKGVERAVLERRARYGAQGDFQARLLTLTGNTDLDYIGV
jgi:hypothetical protein